MLLLQCCCCGLCYHHCRHRHLYHGTKGYNSSGRILQVVSAVKWFINYFTAGVLKWSAGNAVALIAVIQTKPRVVWCWLVLRLTNCLSLGKIWNISLLLLLPMYLFQCWCLHRHLWDTTGYTTAGCCYVWRTYRLHVPNNHQETSLHRH